LGWVPKKKFLSKFLLSLHPLLPASLKTKKKKMGEKEKEGKGQGRHEAVSETVSGVHR